MGRVVRPRREFLNEFALPVDRYLAITCEGGHDLCMAQALRYRLHLRRREIHRHIIANQHRLQRVRVEVGEAGGREGMFEDLSDRVPARPALSGKADRDEAAIVVKPYVVAWKERIVWPPGVVPPQFGVGPWSRTRSKC